MEAKNLIESPINWAEIDRGAKCVVYAIRHLASGAEYVGSTGRPIRQRIKEHRKDVRQGSHHSLHAAIRTFGWNAFELEILAYCDKATLRQSEIKHINSRACLFNQAKGGVSPSSNWHHSIETRQAQATAKVGSLNPAARRVSVNGVEYSTLKECCESVKISFPTLRSRLVSEEYPGYFYVEESHAG